MIVVDANVLSFYLIQGERTAEAQALQRLDAEWLVPSFWVIEFQSILRKYVRFQGLPQPEALHLLDRARALYAVNEVVPDAEMTLRDALTWGISVYDAQYVSLARQYGVACVTGDGPLQRKCPGVAVALTDFLARARPGGSVREPRAAYSARK